MTVLKKKRLPSSSIIVILEWQTMAMGNNGKMGHLTANPLTDRPKPSRNSVTFCFRYFSDPVRSTVLAPITGQKKGRRL